MRKKRFVCRLSDNEWSGAVANLLHKYETGQTLTPNVDLNKSVTLPNVQVEMSPQTKKLVIGIVTALTIGLLYTGYKNH
jgi:hypothetical protein